jgi:acyl-CoA oxidase
MPGAKVNEDLLRERAKCTFDTTELTNFIDGGKQGTAERRELGKYY